MRPGSCRGVAAELGRGGGSSTLADRSPEVFWSSLARDRGRSPPGRGGAGAEGSAVGLYLACPRQRPRPPEWRGHLSKVLGDTSLSLRRGLRGVGKREY